MRVAPVGLLYPKGDPFEIASKLAAITHGHPSGYLSAGALAISVYCALKYKDDFKQGLIASVNHDGDSDSTGAITGNILGAYLGLDNIPKEWIDKVEIGDVVLDMGRRICERKI